MKNFSLIFFLILTVSCYQELEQDSFKSLIKSSSLSESVVLKKNKDTVEIKLIYKTTPQLTNEYLSSITALTYYDTAIEILEKEKINFVKLNIVNPNGTEIYTYPLLILEKSKIGMETSAFFLQNMLNKQAEKNQNIVDESKISIKDLVNLNQISSQIQESLVINNITYDGFVAHKDDSNVIEIRAQILSNSESIGVVFQFDLNSNKIFYFGINE